MNIKFISHPISQAAVTIPAINPVVAIMVKAHMFSANYILRSLIEVQKCNCNHWYACPKIVLDASAYFSHLGFGQSRYEEIAQAIPDMIRDLYGCKIRFTRIMQFLARLHCQLIDPRSTENLPHAIDLGLQCHFLGKAEHSDLKRRISDIDYSFKGNMTDQQPDPWFTPAFRLLAGFLEYMGPNSENLMWPPDLNKPANAAFEIFRKSGYEFAISTFIQERRYDELHRYISALQAPCFDQFLNLLYGPLRAGTHHRQQPWAAIFALICYSHREGKLSAEICKFILEIAKKEELVTPDELERLQKIIGADKIVAEPVRKPKTIRPTRTVRPIRKGINTRINERKAQIQFYANMFFEHIVPVPRSYCESQAFMRFITHGSDLGEMSPLMLAAHELLIFSGVMYEVDQFVSTNDISDVNILTELWGIIVHLVSERISIPNAFDVDERNTICFFALILAYRHLELTKLNKEILTVMLGIADDLGIFDMTTVTNLRNMINN